MPGRLMPGRLVAGGLVLGGDPQRLAPGGRRPRPQVALPVRMTQGMGHPATLLGIFWTLFAVGEVTGAWPPRTCAAGGYGR